MKISVIILFWVVFFLVQDRDTVGCSLANESENGNEHGSGSAGGAVRETAAERKKERKKENQTSHDPMTRLEKTSHSSKTKRNETKN